jgi:hypothetical protein
METREQILARDYSEEFDALRQNRIVQSWYKYGWTSETYGNKLADAMACAEQRVALYRKTGNREHLVDAANFLMIEYMHPQHPNAHFRAESSEESPGLVGISAKQLMEQMK